MSASSKDEFNSAYQRFVMADMTDKPMLFEVFTDSRDESDALQAVLSCVMTSKELMREKSKELMRDMLGEHYKTIGKIYHRLKG